MTRLTNEELYDILADHFMYCEEDSWERSINIDHMTYEEMLEYYTNNIA
jgi:hypothetical protein